MSEGTGAQTKGTPDPLFLADFLVSNLLQPRQKFNVRSERLTEALTNLPENVRELVRGWTKIYLAWLFKTYALKRYGVEFTNTLVQIVREKLQEEGGEAKKLWSALEYWFTNLDNVTDRVGTSVDHWEIPFEVLVALCFMIFDADSPYYRKPSGETNMVEFDIGFILGSAAREAKQIIQQTIDAGRPVNGAQG